MFVYHWTIPLFGYPVQGKSFIFWELTRVQCDHRKMSGRMYNKVLLVGVTAKSKYKWIFPLINSSLYDYFIHIQKKQLLF